VKRKAKILVLIYGLTLPYVALVLYFALRLHDHPLPTWFPYFGLSYMLASMLVVVVVSRNNRHTTPPEKAARPVSGWRWVLRAWMGYLVVLWSGFFLWGAYLALKGRLEWQRSLLAGAFLLAFIALFSWALCKDFTRQDKPTEETTKRN